MKLTTKAIADFRMPQGKQDHWEPDNEIPNLYLRARSGGSKALVFSYKYAGRTRKITLGSATAINISKARETARDLNARVRLGQDPAKERDEAQSKARQTVGALIPRFLNHERSHLSPRWYANKEHHLLVHAKPLHPLQIDKVEKRDVATCLAPVAENSGERTSDIVRASLSSLYVWAITQGLADRNPVIGTLRHAQKSRDRVLSPAELRIILNNLGDDHFGSIIRLLAYLGQRAGEVSGLRWSEIDFNANSILLASSRTKNGRPHTVPMSDPVRAILAAQPRRITPNGELRDLIFGIGEGPFSGWSKSKQALDERIAAATGSPLAPWRVHDLRRSFVTHCAEIGIAPHIIEAAVNHISGHKGGVAGTYNRAVYAREVRIALDRWAEWLTAIVEGRQSNIVALSQPA
jgi:integrase